MIVGLLTLAVAAPQDLGSFDLRTYRPSLSSHAATGMPQTATPGWLDAQISLAYDYAYRPLVIRDRESDNEIAAMMEAQSTAHLLCSLGLYEGLQLGLGVPVVAQRKLREEGRDLARTGIGDVDLSAHYNFLPRARYGIGAAAFAATSLPTGDAASLIGSSQLSPSFGVLGDMQIGPALASASLGYRMRFKDQFAGRNLPDQLLYTLGADVTITKATGALVQLFGATSVGSAAKERPAEIIAGAHQALGDYAVMLGGGLGLTDGAGTPAFRVLVAVSYQYGIPYDYDDDGMVDDVDPCPREAEDHDGFEDSDGCPETNPEIIFTARVRVVFNDIEFATDSDQLKPESFPILDRIVRSLLRQPLVKIRIEGHTDNQGNADRNLRLSQLRSIAVLNYLVEQGIARERLSYAGFGESRPVESNETIEGQAKNRRVEFLVLG